MSDNAQFAARLWAALGEDTMTTGHRWVVCVGCGQEAWHEAKGLCRRCYDKAPAAKAARAAKRTAGGLCSRCGRPMAKIRRGLCNTCYQADYRAAHAGEVGNGWTVADVALALGERRATVRGWIAARHLLAYTDGTLSDQSLHNFLWAYSAAWDWARVDPGHVAWVRSLLHDPDVRLGASKAARAARLAVERAGVAA